MKPKMGGILEGRKKKNCGQAGGLISTRLQL
jgi:hypothetical protein